MAQLNGSYSSTIQPSQLPNVSILDLFFPGLSVVSPAIQQLATGGLNSYTGLLCMLWLSLFLANYLYERLRSLAENHFSKGLPTNLDLADSTLAATVYVSSGNEAYDMLISWVSQQAFVQKAHSTLVRVGCQRGARFSSHVDWKRKKPLTFSPWSGSFFFFYKGHLLKFRSQEKDNFWGEEVSISCIGLSPDILKDLFETCRAEYLTLIEKETSVFENRGHDWRKSSARPVRPLDTVIINEDIKQLLLKDMKNFLAPESRTWHEDRGVPYRRGYIFYGLPGTGKSSLSLALAGHFDLDIYVLNLSSVSDGSLADLFSDLPPRCVVLLEDVDANNVVHTRQKSPSATKSNTADAQSNGELTMSGVLNVLDGIASTQGRIVIMTTNHIERLDDALIRPGRIDQKIELGLADKEIIVKLFRLVYGSSETAKDDKSGAKDKASLEELATKCAGHVPEREFSPAEITSFFLENRESPHYAAVNMKEWIDKAREQKGRIKRADSWVLST